MTHATKPRLTPGRLWWLFNYNRKRGLPAAWHHYVVSPRITAWRNPHADQPVQPVPIHMLAGHEQATPGIVDAGELVPLYGAQLGDYLA